MKTKTSDLTQDDVRHLLDYNPSTGYLYWKNPNCSCLKVGVRAGGLNKQRGYRNIRVNNVLYREHRIIWLYVNGYFLEQGIDHINGVKDDNRITNLREVSQQCNSRNCIISKNNTSGVTGVRKRKSSGHWKAVIGINNQKVDLGTYRNFDDAVKARWEAEVKYGFPNCNTTSTAYNYLKDNNLL